jgi:hypothetical protein
VNRTKLVGALAASTCLLVWFGCSGRQNRPIPTIGSLPQEEVQSVGSARYDVAQGGQIEIYHQGYGVRNVQGVPVGTMRIQISVRNDGASPIRNVQGVPVGTMRIQISVRNDGASPIQLDASQTHLVDSRGDTLNLGALRRDSQPTPSLVEVESGSHAQVDLFFDLPKGYSFEKVDNFRVYWGHLTGGVRTATETLFVRKDPGNMYWVDGRGKKRPYRYFMAVKV